MTTTVTQRSTKAVILADRDRLQQELDTVQQKLNAALVLLAGVLILQLLF